MLACTIAIALTVQGCSSRPRDFNPTLAAPAASQTDFDGAYATCRQLLVEGKLDASGRSGSAGAGAAAGATTAVAGGALASAGGYAGLAAASATIVLLPFAIVGGAWGMAKMKRARKERAIKDRNDGLSSRSRLSGCRLDQNRDEAGHRHAVMSALGGKLTLAMSGLPLIYRGT